MKKTITKVFLAVLSVSFILNVYAHKVPSENLVANKSTSAAGCVPATGKTDIDINNVKARINTGGDMWWDLQGNALYEVPKGSGKMSMYSASLWIGGVDVNGQLKLAALRYRQIGNDFWTGPLTTDGAAAISPEVCLKYDRHFAMTRQEVNLHIAWYNSPQDYPDYEIPRSILEWPAHGDVSLGQSFYLAPFYSPNGNAVYTPEDGDYPYYDITNELCRTSTPTAEGNGILADQVIKGDQTLWWVFNDKGNIHTETQGDAIGMEIRGQAFAFATNDEINNMTFYSYELINRSTYRLTETYFSQWVDPDLGAHLDDFVGCDVLRGLGYCYNGTAVDGDGAPHHYGAQPPAIGVDFFQGPYMDHDGLDNPKYDANNEQICDVSINGVNFGDDIIDNERFGMRRFVYHNNSTAGAPPYMHDPDIAIQYYNYLKGIWKDNTKMLYGGNAHNSAGAYGPECDFMFPGDSDPCNWGTGGMPPNGDVYWTEETAGNQPNDRRFMQSAGPFTLEPGAVNYITVGIVWARASTGGAFASVQLLRLVDDKAQRLFDNCFKVLDGPDAPELTIQELDRELILYISNPSYSNNKKEGYYEWDPSIIAPEHMNLTEPWDSLYRFEGYQIFQLKDATVSVSDIHDANKARLVAQCDIENFNEQGQAVGQLVNWYYSDQHAGNIPTEEVNGSNEGISHTFKILNDEFATGNRRLVNHKQYYYLAIAYAYNSYMSYSQDPGTLNGLYGQKKPYLAGRKSAVGGPIQAVVGIPHFTTPGGQILNAAYGDGPKITRIEGQGNGGNWLELTDESLAEIMSGAPWKTLHPTYKNKRGPVDIKVIDPLKVAQGEYTLKFNVTTDSINKATWTLIDNQTGHQYQSDTSIVIANEQLFLDLGISITIKQTNSPGYGLEENNGMISSSISYADSSRRWLGGVPDIDGTGAFNWIRSGTLRDADDNTNNDYDIFNEDSEEILDANEVYEKIIGSTWAPYRLSSRYANGPMLTTAFNQNKIQNIASVDIVLTSDKSKWTRCPVIEMGHEFALNEGKSKRFELRRGASVDKNGNPDNSGTGMSWFPGYAINVETGERLNMMFGEDSRLLGENGRDMKFNPTSTYLTSVGQMLYSYGLYADADPEVMFGGKHYIYVMGSNQNTPDFCPSYDEGQWIYNKLYAAPNQSPQLTNQMLVFRDVMYTSIPLSIPGEEWLSNDVTIRIRVSKPYAKNYSTYGAANPLNNNYPLYTFTMDDLAPEFNNVEAAKDALDLINVVPNPYYAYSAYETNQLDNRIKITNLPQKCTVSIYTVNGTLVRQYTKDEEKTSVDWDLKNHAGIPIAGGVYLIHVKADGIGEKVIKWFGILRPTDLQSF
ncbi:MAG: T9SS type A sorting domain-containing protein [Bacteroidales bacterium]|nr:T9SS type A sorting domain-containing protein [Bacteroidales bacterium]